MSIDNEPQLTDAVHLDSAARTQVGMAQALRLLAAYELGDSFSGQLICRTTTGDFAISPMGRPWNCVEPDEVVIASATVVLDRSAGMINYAAAVNGLGLLERPNVNAVVHIHSPAGSVLGALGAGIEPYSQEACLFFENQAMVADRFDFDPHRPQWLASSIGDCRILVIRNHGVMVQGAQIADAMAFALQYEACAEGQLQLLANGRPYTVIPPLAARNLRNANGSLPAATAWYRVRLEETLGLDT